MYNTNISIIATLDSVALVLALIATTLLFVESLQKPEHQDNLIYKIFYSIWRFSEIITNPSKITTVANFVAAAFWLAPVYLSKRLSDIYFRGSYAIYRRFGGNYFSLFLRDRILPLIFTCVSLFFILEIFFEYGAFAAFTISISFSIFAMLPEIILIVAIILAIPFGLAIIILGLLKDFLKSLFLQKKWSELRRQHRESLEKYKKDIDQKANQPYTGNMRSVKAIITFVPMLIACIACFIFPFVLSIYLLEAISRSSIYIIMFPIFVVSQIFFTQLIANFFYIMEMSNSSEDYHWKIATRASEFAENSIYILILQVGIFYILSVIYDYTANDIEYVLLLSALVGSNFAGLQFLILACRKQTAFDVSFSDPDDTFFEVLDSAIKHEKNVSEETVLLVLLNILLCLLFGIICYIFFDVFTRKEMKYTEEMYELFVQSSEAQNKDRSVGLRLLIAINIVSIPLVFLILFGFFLSMMKILAGPFRKVTEGTWALAQPYPLVARFISWLVGLYTFLRLSELLPPPA